MASEELGVNTRSHKRSEPLNKRRRIALACSACRARKSRCDGQRPSCSTCNTLSIECEYEPSDSSTNVLVKKEYVSNLEQRLKDVERSLQRHDDLLTGHLSACSTTTEATRIDLYHSRSGLNMLRQIPAKSQPDSLEEDESRESDEAKTDGLAMIFVDEESPVYYGESSNIAFIRYLFQAIWMDSTITIPHKASAPSECSSVPFSQQQSPSTVQSPKNSRRLPSLLPPVDEMDYLIDLYFRGYGSMFPFLHELTFRARYDECKIGDNPKVGDPWLGLLNMVFAMASYADQNGECSAKNRFRKSFAFFNRAESLCSEPSMRTVSLDIVHYLLLAVLYLQGTQRSIQTWNLHGVLVRAAMSMGLHSSRSGQRLEPIQQEVHRRTWLTIYCLDKILSVAFGRPPSIPDEYIVVPLPSPWTSIIHSPKHLADVDINTEFFHASVRLYQIIGRSMSTQYRLNLGLTDQDMDESTSVQKASAMRQELRQWASGLPPRLSLCEPGSVESLKGIEPSRLRIILTLRYHFTSILIHRPLLCAMLRYLTTQDKPVGKPLPYRIQLAMAEAQECIRSAEATIDIVHIVLTAQNKGSSNLGVWFFTLFYVFTSSLIILGCSLLAHHGVCDRDDATNASGNRYLAKTSEALDKLDKDNSLVYDCAKFIRNVSEQLRGQIVALAGEQDEPGDHPGLQAERESEISAYDHSFSSLELSTFAGLVGDDLEMVQFSGSGLFDAPFDESTFEQPHF